MREPRNTLFLSKKNKFFSQNLLTNSAKSDIILSVERTNSQQKKPHNIAVLCNGSTADSDSVCWGSNPYTAVKSSRIIPWGFFFSLTWTNNEHGAVAFAMRQPRSSVFWLCMTQTQTEPPSLQRKAINSQTTLRDPWNTSHYKRSLRYQPRSAWQARTNSQLR